MTDALERFKTYDFDGDERWRSYYINLTLPAGRENDATLLLKCKAKWYKANVESDLDVNQFVKSVFAHGNTSSSSTATGPRDDHQRAQHLRSPQPSGRASSGRTSAPTGRQQSATSFPLGDVCVAIGSCVLVASTILALQPFDVFLAHASLRYAILTSLALHGFKLKRRVGGPQLNLASLQQWFQRAAPTAEAAALFSTLVIVGIGSLCWLPLVALSIRGIYDALEILHRMMTPFAAWRDFGGAKAHGFALRYRDQAMFAAAGFEILAAFQLAFAFMRVGVRALTPSIMYAQLLRRQYWSSDSRRYHAEAWKSLDSFTRPYIGNIPIVQRAIGAGQQWFDAPGHRDSYHYQ